MINKFVPGSIYVLPDIEFVFMIVGETKENYKWTGIHGKHFVNPNWTVIEIAKILLEEGRSDYEYVGHMDELDIGGWLIEKGVIK